VEVAGPLSVTVMVKQTMPPSVVVVTFAVFTTAMSAIDGVEDGVEVECDHELELEEALAVLDAVEVVFAVDVELLFELSWSWS
jgi:hypothetical protein